MGRLFRRRYQRRTLHGGVRTRSLRTPGIEFAVMDGDITVAGAQGLRALLSMTNFSRSEPLEEAISVSVTAKPTYAANPPSWMTVAA